MPGPQRVSSARGALCRACTTRNHTGIPRYISLRLSMELDQARALIKATQELEEQQPIKAAE